MSEWSHLYNTAKWKRIRQQFLFDNPVCLMCASAGKPHPANEVDHILPHCGDLELFWDEDNYQSLCKPCHSSKTFYETIKTTRLPNNLKLKSNDITLLFGPPCSGKTTWAKKQQKTIIDFDSIKSDISGQNPYDMDSKYLSMCIAVRNKMIKESTGPLIIIATLPELNARADWINKLNAKPLLMITPQYECIKRLKKSNRPNKAGYTALIKRWFEKFKPLGNEEYVK